MRFQYLQDWLDWLETCHPREIELGLERIGRVAEALDFSFSRSKVITVAGTNGKGSCVATLSCVLTAAGYQTATYTSPHLLHYNERIGINGVPVSDQDIVQAFARVDEARQSVSLSYFEFGTLAALDIFNRLQPEVMVLEVGLGGRLDAVNIIDPDVAVITSIDLDHQDWLGDDRELIGREKAGILRRHRPLVCGDVKPPEIISREAERGAATLFQRDSEFSIIKQGEQQWSWRGCNEHGVACTLSDLPRPALPLNSVAAALQAIVLLQLPVERSAYNALSNLQLPGRYQQLSYRGYSIILDVAHNPAAADYLSAQLQDDKHTACTYALFALMKDKDCAAIVDELKASVDNWLLPGLPNVPRAMAANELAEYILTAPVSVYTDTKQALDRALSLMSGNDRLLVVGSFFLVAEVLKIITLKGDIDG